MNGTDGYAVFFFPQALEALGEAIKPYLMPGPEPWVLCNEIDTGGALIEMTLQGQNKDGKPVQIELMVPSGMVRMIVSAHSDGVFGFGPQGFEKPTTVIAAASSPAVEKADADEKPKA